MNNYDFVVFQGNRPERVKREYSQLVQASIGALLKVSQADPRDPYDENRVGMLTTEPELYKLIKNIGANLHRVGGLDLMEYVAQGFARRVPYDMPGLRYAWDGIGDWHA